jgi:hypothetical protein
MPVRNSTSNSVCCKALANGGDQVVLDAQNVLQQFKQVVLFHVRLDRQDFVPEPAAIAAALSGLQQFDAEVVQIDLQHLDAAPTETGNLRLASVLMSWRCIRCISKASFGPEFADVERQIVVQPAHLQEALAADHLDK